MPGDRGHGGSEAGFTVFEVLVAVSIFIMALVIALSSLSSVQNSVTRADSRSQTNDQARLAVEQLDRQIRSGNLLYDPALESPPGLSLRVYTQANGTQRCVQWRILNGELQTRSWPETYPTIGTPSGWRTVADGIVNNASQPAFILPAGFEKRLIEIDLRVNHNPKKGSTVRVTSSVAGRNTQYQYASTVCNTVPPS
ncbi:MAG TPA: hypothetical protein VNA57_06475 [Acidimicrobiales bacterium]|nr:hypothetical protein [Acidimicrobiales bacterium]